MPKLILVCGCSGVGKTTFCREFAQNHNFRYIGADDFYAIINGDEKIRDNKFEVWIALFKAVHECEIKGIDCIVDSNALNESARNEFLNWFPNFEHHLIYIEADLKLRLQNNKQRDRQVPEDIMRKMMVITEPPVWNSLDRRWLSLTRLFNENNNYTILCAYGKFNVKGERVFSC